MTPLGEKLDEFDVPGDDPFFYGWRTVCRRGPNGRQTTVEVPLTEEDVLHPREGDHIMNGSLHGLIVAYLLFVASLRTRHEPTALVRSDFPYYWEDPALRHHSPDLSVTFGVRDPTANRESFQVAEEGVRPVLFLEVTSRSTRRVDHGTKLRHYYQARVPLYVIFDRPRSQPPRPLGYRWTATGYEAMDTDARGRLWIAPIRVWLAAEGDRAVCFDERDQVIPDYVTMAAQREAETAALQAAEERVRQLEAELRRLRGDS